ncbi:MAG: acyl-CoA thioesterase [Halieaceae bacterium]|jgi:acyl-CoA thioester hydrolase|nr:acyl-CoA thioesterase [Halieaceae bacterium]
MSAFPYSNTVTVRFRDTDAQGHLYFANYLVYADEIGGLYMTELGFSMHQISAIECYVFTVNLQCDYIGECTANDEVRVSVGYLRLGNSSADMGFELCNDNTGEILVRGQFTHVFADKSTRKSTPIPAALRAAIVARQPELNADT